VQAVDVTSSPSGESEKTAVKPRTETELLELVRASPARVMWMSGAEPLQHPEIGTIARRITESERYLFLETDGALLRRGIFAFRPVAKLFLAVQLHGLEKSHDARACRPGAFGLAMEGIRAAQLSGFHVCAYTEVDGEAKLDELRQLRDELVKMDVDGQIISVAGQVRADSASGRVLREARKIIGHRGWNAFSEKLEESREGLAGMAAPFERTAPSIPIETESIEEGVGAP
jgi:molybdenum cofactor biosynthesis enzyme MoaA